MSRYPEFSTDILIPILSRLPIRSLIKFQCVSKEWFQIIANPQLISAHRERCSRNPSILLARSTLLNEHNGNGHLTRIDICEFNFDGSQKNENFSFHVNELILQIPPSKGGLICLMSLNSLYIFNPATRVLKVLQDVNLAYSISLICGMGCVKGREEYILVNFFHRLWDDDYMIGCDVLRLKDGDENYELKTVDCECTLSVPESGVFVDQIMYWLCNTSIMSLDYENEEFITVKLPVRSNAPISPFSILELEHKLCVFEDTNSPVRSIAIWVLNDTEKDDWICKYNIDLKVCITRLPQAFFVDLWDEKILKDASEGNVKYDLLTDSIFAEMTENGWKWRQIYTPTFFKLVT